LNSCKTAPIFKEAEWPFVLRYIPDVTDPNVY
jgi:hypothetical protein